MENNYYRNGRYVDSAGSVSYYLNNKLHREGDKPALIFLNGYKAYYKHSMLHREKGPAVILSDGSKRWYIYHKEVEPFTPEEYPLILLQMIDL